MVVSHGVRHAGALTAAARMVQRRRPAASATRRAGGVGPGDAAGGAPCGRHAVSTG